MTSLSGQSSLLDQFTHHEHLIPLSLCLMNTLCDASLYADQKVCREGGGWVLKQVKWIKRHTVPIIIKFNHRDES